MISKGLKITYLSGYKIRQIFGFVRCFIHYFAKSKDLAVLVNTKPALG